MNKIEIVSSTSGQVDKSNGTSFLRLCLVCENCPSRQRQIRDGKVSWQIFNRPPLTKNCSVSMENSIELEWSILQGFTSLQILQKNPEWFARPEYWTWKFWRSDVLHVYVQRHWLDKKGIWREMCSEFRRNQDVREQILAMISDVSWPWTGKEMLWNTGTTNTNLKENGIPSLQRWYYDPRKQDTQSLRVPAPWVVESWEEWKKTEETIHFTTDASNTELLFRIIHSVNQLSIYGAVSNWSGQLGQSPNETEPTWEKLMTNKDSVHPEMLKSVDSHEVSSLVNSSRSERASGHRLREDLQNFASQPEPMQLTKNLRTSMILEPGCSWYLTQDPSGHGCWFWRRRSRVQRIHITPGRPRTQSTWSNSRRNRDWTSGEISYCTHCWDWWDWNWNSITESSRKKHLGSWYAEDWVVMWTKYVFQTWNVITPIRNSEKDYLWCSCGWCGVCTLTTLWLTATLQVYEDAQMVWLLFHTADNRVTCSSSWAMHCMHLVKAAILKTRSHCWHDWSKLDQTCPQEVGFLQN